MQRGAGEESRHQSMHAIARWCSALIAIVSVEAVNQEKRAKVGKVSQVTDVPN